MNKGQLHRKLGVIAGVAGLFLAACGDDDSGSTSSTSAPTATTTAATSSAPPETTTVASGAVGFSVVAQSADDHDRFITVVEGPGGMLYASGFVRTGDNTAASVTRFLADGTLDTSFGTNGTAVVDVAPGGGTAEVARGLVVHEDGTIVIATPFEKDPTAAGDAAKDLDVAVARLDDTGTLDASFGDGGISRLDFGAGKLAGETFLTDNVWGLAPRAAGYVVFGTSPNQAADRTDSDFVLAGLDGNGALDATFADAGLLTVDIEASVDNARNVNIKPDGSIVATGYSRDGDGVVSPVLIKTDTNGVLDAAFGNGGVATNVVLPGVTESYQVVFQGENYVLAGYGRGADEEEKVDMVVYRFLADGSLDPTFGQEGLFRLDLAGEDDRARNLTLLPDGNILAVGSGKLTADALDGLLVLLDPDGQPVTSFGDDGHLLVDFGKVGDAFFGVKVTADGSTAWLAGFAGAAADTDERDDSVLAKLAL